MQDKYHITKQVKIALLEAIRRGYLTEQDLTLLRESSGKDFMIQIEVIDSREQVKTQLLNTTR